jgi:Mn-containing catalase
MCLRIDRLRIELPQPKDASPDSAAAVQELRGGRSGAMSTLMNSMYQPFHFRARGHDDAMGLDIPSDPPGACRGRRCR